MTDDAGPLAPGRNSPLVPAEFTPTDPPPLLTPAGMLHFEPLDERHNASDHAAWTGSIAHIRSTPDFARRDWPPDDGSLDLAGNAGDLRAHAIDFSLRTGFTWTVLDERDECVGCVYLYPSRHASYEVALRSWVVADRAADDDAVRNHVYDWLVAGWPFRAIERTPSKN